jgi:hypothetical protein
MWQDYKELCRMYWEFTINHGWKFLIIVLSIWLIAWIILKIKG